MPAYVIVETEIHDPDQYAHYMAASPGAVAAGGGRLVAPGGGTAGPERGLGPPRPYCLRGFRAGVGCVRFFRRRGQPLLRAQPGAKLLQAPLAVLINPAKLQPHLSFRTFPNNLSLECHVGTPPVKVQLAILADAWTLRMLEITAQRTDIPNRHIHTDPSSGRVQRTRYAKLVSWSLAALAHSSRV